MYHTSNQIQVSTPRLIEILLDNGYNIKTDEKHIFLITPYNSLLSVEIEEIKRQLIVSNNKVYELYLQNKDIAIAKKELLIKQAFKEELEDSNIKNIDKIIELLVYYKAISYLVHKNPNTVLLVQRVINKQLNNS